MIPELQFGHSIVRTKLWTVAGNSRKSGKTTLTSAIGGYYAKQSHFVHMLNSDLSDSNAKFQNFDTKNELGLEKLFSTLDDQYRHSLQFIISNITGDCLNGQQEKLRHIFLDLNASVSHDSIDFLLISDYPLIVVEPTLDSLDELGVFLNACIFRLIEHLLPEEETKLGLLSAQLNRRKTGLAQLEIDHIFASYNSEIRGRIKRVLTEFKPNIVINRFTDPIAYRFILKYISTYYRPLLPEIKVVGSLPDEERTAIMLSALKYLFITSRSDPRIKSIAKYLAYKLKNYDIDNSTATQQASDFYVDDFFSIRQSLTDNQPIKKFNILERLN